MNIKMGDINFTVNRIFCIGKNYEAHVQEMKPPGCLVKPGEKIQFPAHGKVLHHEVELVLLIGKAGRAASAEEARTFISGMTLGLDLTLRDIQYGLKEKGLPWEISKAFEQSAPAGDFIPCDAAAEPGNIAFTCRVNGDLRQSGNSKDMIFPIEILIVALSRIWTLQPGDLIFTGTPSGVGLLRRGDRIQVENEQIGSYEWEVV